MNDYCYKNKKIINKILIICVSLQFLQYIGVIVIHYIYVLLMDSPFFHCFYFYYSYCSKD